MKHVGSAGQQPQGNALKEALGDVMFNPVTTQYQHVLDHDKGTQIAPLTWLLSAKDITS